MSEKSVSQARSGTVFVSYKSDDRERVQPLVAALEAQGWQVWWDRKNLPGVDWHQEISQALAAARCVVVVWSENLLSGDMDWVLSEAEDGRRRGILVPVMIDPVALPKPFDRTQTADLVDWVPGTAHGGLDGVLAAIARVLGSQVDPARLPRPVFPTAHAMIAGCGVLATLGPLAYIARVRPASTALGFLLVLIAGAAGATTFSLLRGLFPWSFFHLRSLRNLKLPVALAASAIVAAVATFGSFLLGVSGVPVAVRFHGPGGTDDCPSKLVNTQAVVRHGDRMRELTIDESCEARYRVSRELKSDSITVDLVSPNPFFVEEPLRQRPWGGSPVLVAVASVAVTPRSKITLFPYHGAAETSARFSEFEGNLDAKITTLTAQLLDDPAIYMVSKAAAQLGRLKIEPTSAAIASSLHEKMEIWQSTHSLGLLSGTLTQDEGFKVISQVFIGDLDGTLTGRSFSLTMHITGEDFGNTRDGHAAAFLFALGMDARRLGFPGNVVNTYLSHAYEIVQTIEQREDRVLVEEAKALRMRIDVVLIELRHFGG